MRFIAVGILIWLSGLSSCMPSSTQASTMHTNLQMTPISQDTDSPIPGAHRLSLYLPMIQSKKVGLVVNHTSYVEDAHLVDTLLKLGVDVRQIFAPEHGFRGQADAGEHLSNEVDPKSNIQVISLYGKKKAPDQADLKDIDILIFDIQDVGVRFYTYISTLWYVMKAAAEIDKPLVVLDRPNPNGHYIDGPILEDRFKSFVGLLPIPVVYGMTIGELAGMINGEQWLDGMTCDLTVIPCKNYDHNTYYTLPIAPSPNLPNMRAILLYPSLCFFEGTDVSVGRGTDKQFQIYGHPSLKERFSFTPIPNIGSKDPPHMHKLCYGVDLSDIPVGQLREEAHLNLDYLLSAYKAFSEQGIPFFLKSHFIDKLAGTDQLRLLMEQGLDRDGIIQNWQPSIEDFKNRRLKYLLYP